jgi:sugar lactone lactonase YvrE
MIMDTSVVVDGLSFPESPRWHEDRLYVSDMGTGQVLGVDPARGETAVRVERVPGRPSGLAWDEEGCLLVVSMGRMAVYRDDGGERLTPVADLASFTGGWRNDAVRHPDGWLYVGAIGRPSDLVMVDPAGKVQTVASELGAPNGLVITPDGQLLIAAEFAAQRLIAFQIAPDGTLSGQRVWAALPDGCTPDGICLDQEGAVWLAWGDTDHVLRVAEGGAVRSEVTCRQPAFACMLGGADRRTLYICTAPGSHEDDRRQMRGRIESVAVAVPGAGFP